MIFLCFINKIALRQSLLQEVELANQELKYGKINEAQKIFETLYNENSQKPVVTIAYTNFLYKQGRYNEIIKIYESYKNDITTKMKEIYENSKRNLKLEQRMVDNLDFLYKESPYKKNYVLRIAVKYMKKYEYIKANDILQQAKETFKNDNDIQLEIVHLLFLEGKYKEAFENIPEDARHKQIFIDFKNLHAKAKRVEAMIIENDTGYDDYNSYRIQKQSENKFRAYKNLIDEIKDTMHKDTFTPSILTELRDTLIEAFLFIGKSLAIKGLSRYAKDLIKSKPTDDNKYYYINSLIQDKNIEQASSEMNYLKFKNTLLKDRLVNLINKEKERQEKIQKEEELRKKKQREDEKRRREQQQKQWQYQQKQQQQKYGKKGGDDPKGYYKIIGVNKNASEDDIRKKYKKLIRIKDPDAYKGTDQKKKEALTEELMKINEAKTVLLDKEKRQLYDQGLYDQQNQGYGGYRHAGGADVNDIFKAFFGGGSGGTFFTSDNGGGRYEQRTYFYL